MWYATVNSANFKGPKFHQAYTAKELVKELEEEYEIEKLEDHRTLCPHGIKGCGLLHFDNNVVEITITDP